MTPTQVFSSEFYEIFKNTFYRELLRWLLQGNLSNLPFWVLLPVSKVLNYITYFHLFKKRYMNTLFFMKTNKFYFMFTLFKFFVI